MVPDEGRSFSTLRDYLDAVRRRKWLILTCMVLTPLVAVLVSRQEEPLYQASAQVLIKRQDLGAELQDVNDPTAGDATRILTTEAQLARVPEVVRRTIAAAGVEQDPSELLGASSVTTQENSDILVFTVSQRDPALATRLATEYAREYSRYRNELANRSITAALRSLEDRIAALEAAGKNDSALETSLVTTAAQLRTLQAVQTARAIVIREAGGAGRIQPNPRRAGILGSILGIVLGLGFAFLAEAVDTRIRSEEQVIGALSLPILGRLPKPPSKIRNQNRLLALDAREDPGVEALHMLAVNLDFVTFESPAKVIMVTSAAPGEGKTTTLANLGVVLARQGRKVTLVDLDFIAPGLHRVFGIGDGPGLTDVVLGQADLEDAVVRLDLTEFDHDGLRGHYENAQNLSGDRTDGDRNNLTSGSLDVLRAGTPPPNVGAFASLDAFRRILGELRERSDIVVLDSSPLLLSGEAVALTAQVDAILVVTKLKHVRSPALQELHRVLEASPTRKLGFVATNGTPIGQYGHGSYPHRSPTSAERSFALRSRGR